MESSGLAVVLARTLSGRTDGLHGAGPRRPMLIAAVSTVRTLAEARSLPERSPALESAWSSIPDGKLRRFLLATSAGRREFIHDPQLGPVALVGAVRAGAGPGPSLQRWRMKAPRHPSLTVIAPTS